MKQNYVNLKFNPVTIGVAIGIIKVASAIIEGTALWGAEKLIAILEKKTKKSNDNKEKADE